MVVLERRSIDGGGQLIEREGEEEADCDDEQGKSSECSRYVLVLLV